MEKLILFLIVFGIGSLFEYLKQQREKRAGNEPVSPPVMNMARPRRTEKAEKAPEPKKPEAESRHIPLPKSNHVPVMAATAPLPDEGGSIMENVEILDEAATGAIFRQPEQDEKLKAHYERWRRAIIDSEIISRKY